jgi:hypothetical protein
VLSFPIWEKNHDKKTDVSLTVQVIPHQIVIFSQEPSLPNSLVMVPPPPKRYPLVTLSAVFREKCDRRVYSPLSRKDNKKERSYANSSSLRDLSARSFIRADIRDEDE